MGAGLSYLSQGERRVASLLDNIGVNGEVETDYRHQEKDKKIDMKLC